jgi:hypothetical protein
VDVYNLSAFCSKPVFWHRAYYVGSVGGAHWTPCVRTWMRRAPSSTRENPKQKDENCPLDPSWLDGFAYAPLRGGPA